jgi:hypothetical protein
MRGGIHLRADGDDGAGMDAGEGHRFRKKGLHGAGKGHPRVGHPDDGFAGGGEALGGDDGGSRAVFGDAKVFGVLGKREIAGLGDVRVRKAGQHRLVLAHDFALEPFCYFSNGKTH